MVLISDDQSNSLIDDALQNLCVWVPFGCGCSRIRQEFYRLGILA